MNCSHSILCHTFVCIQVYVISVVVELFSPVQLVLVGIIRVSVSSGLWPGKHHRRAARRS